jgi:O-antigen ligase
MVLPLAVAQWLKEGGVIAAALAAAGAFVLPSQRARAFAALLALALTPVLLVGEIWDTEQFRPVRDQPATVIAAAAAGLVVLVALAAVFTRWPGLMPVLAVGALPFRIPVATGGQSANLLVPLYVVVSAGVLAYVWRRLRHPEQAAAEARRPTSVELALLAAVVLYAAQCTYSGDFQKGLENVVFFYVPFLLLLKLLVIAPWSRRTILACGAVALTLALVFVGIGFWEYSSRTLLWNPKVIESNQYEDYFRVNSLFFDPSIYGRYLAMVMIGLATWLLWSSRRLHAVGATLALGGLWAGLLLTFSQSSFTALLVGLAVLAALRWPPRLIVAIVATAAVAGALFLLIAPGTVKLEPGSTRSLDQATSGRFDLLRGGGDMFAHRPLFGFGSGAFEKTFREREEVSSQRAAAASHTIPVTDAAEQGLIGLIAYLAVLLTAARVLFSGHRLLRRRWRGPPPVEALARAFSAAAFTALVAHTLLYAAFLEDPIAWTLLGMAIALSASSSAWSASSSEPRASSQPSASAGDADASASPSAARTRTGSHSP